MIKLALTTIQLKELEEARDHSPKPYIRERAAAIIKVSQGKSGRDVAFNGLLKTRRKHTVYQWIQQYKSMGISGLEIKKGRGRKPSFFPSIRATSQTTIISSNSTTP